VFPISPTGYPVPSVRSWWVATASASGAASATYRTINSAPCCGCVSISRRSFAVSGSVFASTSAGTRIIPQSISIAAATAGSGRPAHS
jgi:hypothetical protein